MLSALAMMCIALGYYIPYHFDLVASWFSPDNYELHLPYWYIKPYVKGLYGIIGFASGKLLLARPKCFEKLELRLLLVNLGMGLMALAVFSQIPNYRDIYHVFETWSRTENTAYIGSSTIIVALSFAAFTTPIVYKHVSFVTFAVSTKKLDIMGRLGFCASMASYTIGMAYHFGHSVPRLLNEYQVLRFLFCVTFYSFAVAIPLSVFFEQPCIALRNYIKGRSPHGELPLLEDQDDRPEYSPFEEEMEDSGKYHGLKKDN
jgi:hypothetical protein